MNTTDQSRWDLDAIRQGAAVCLTLAVPFRIIAAIIDTESSGLSALLFFAYLAFFVIGSGCAAWLQQTGTPFSHALVTAIGTAFVAEAIFVIVRLIRGTDISWFAVFVALSLMVIVGMIGGALGSRLQAQGFVPSSRR